MIHKVEYRIKNRKIDRTKIPSLNLFLPTDTIKVLEISIKQVDCDQLFEIKDLIVNLY
jgi:hypothetical protein